MTEKRKARRHGDIILIEVPEEELKRLNLKPDPLGHLVLAEGEATGHLHEVLAPTGEEAFLYENEDGTLFLRVTEAAPKVGVELVHPEHDTILLPTGTYEVRRQREYEPERGFMNVAD